MRRGMEGWTGLGWVILLVALLMSGTIGSGLLLSHASALTSLPTADPQTHAGPADPTTAPAPGANTDLAVGLDPTGAPILLP